MLRGLDLGVNDCLARPVDRNELLARVRTQLRQKRYADSSARKGAAVDRTGAVRSVDRPQQSPLHGKSSRHDARQRARAPRAADADDPRHRSLQAGQRHLRPRCRRRSAQGASPTRLRGIIRGGDLLCRLGGEEFVIVMPGVNVHAAARIAERARLAIQQEQFVIDKSGRMIPVTVSIGLAERDARRRRRLALSGAPTARSIAPRTRAATASAPTRRKKRASPSFPALRRQAAESGGVIAASSARPASTSNGSGPAAIRASAASARRSEAPASSGALRRPRAPRRGRRCNAARCRGRRRTRARARANGPPSAFIDRSSLRSSPSKPIAPRMISPTTIGEVVAGTVRIDRACRRHARVIAIGASRNAAERREIARGEFVAARRRRPAVRDGCRRARGRGRGCA